MQGQGFVNRVVCLHKGVYRSSNYYTESVHFYIFIYKMKEPLCH
jgi:hypothetical protein